MPSVKDYIRPESRPSMYDEPQNSLEFLNVDADEM
jgi:hypothetical protein